MATINKSSKLFLERYGLKTTHRGPLPRVNMRDLPIHSMTLKRPMPLPDLVLPTVQLTTNDPWHLGPPPDDV